MSKYHPLDVRHPANRDLLSRNFLLDPPSASAGAEKAPARTTAEAALRAASATGETRQPGAPWARSDRSTTPVGAAPATPRRGRFFWNAFIVIVFLVIFGSQNGMLGGLLDNLRLLAWQNGVTLPF